MDDSPDHSPPSGCGDLTERSRVMGEICVAQSMRVKDLLERSGRVLREARALTRPDETDGGEKAPPD